MKRKTNTQPNQLTKMAEAFGSQNPEYTALAVVSALKSVLDRAGGKRGIPGVGYGERRTGSAIQGTRQTTRWAEIGSVAGGMGMVVEEHVPSLRDTRFGAPVTYTIRGGNGQASVIELPDAPISSATRVASGPRKIDRIVRAFEEPARAQYPELVSVAQGVDAFATMAGVSFRSPATHPLIAAHPDPRAALLMTLPIRNGR